MCNNMFAGAFGVFCVFLSLCCCSKGQGHISMTLENRTSIALAGQTLYFHLNVKVLVNTSTTVKCSSYKQDEVYKEDLPGSLAGKTVPLRPDIIMHNSSASGQYHCDYQGQKVHFAVLVRDMGYHKPDKVLKSDVISLMTVTIFLLLFSATGSIYIYKWHKGQSLSGVDSDKAKERKGGSNVGATDMGPTSESVYTTLEPRPVSIYDVLNVDEDRTESTERKDSKKKAPQAEEGTFESVYENL